MKRSRSLPGLGGTRPPSLVLAARPGEAPGIDELSRKMLSWSHLWTGSCGSCALTEKHSMVRERLLSWIRRCIGGQARGVLASRGEDVSLASSAPLLTAFLGRRAMRELSRRVLNDL